MHPMRFLFWFFIFTAAATAVQAQSIVGKWRTIDDNTGEQRSVVEIFERDGRYFGRIVKLFPRKGEEADPVCKACPKDDDRYNKKVVGMEIIRNLKAYPDYLADGNILDPEAGKVYRCRLWLSGDDLMVRGYWGPFFRTQTWKRAN